MINKNLRPPARFFKHRDVGRNTTPSRDRYRLVFTKLDPNRIVTSTAFKDAGYYGIKLDKAAAKDAPAIMQWCYDAYGANYAWIESYVWFLTEEDAMLFRFTWGKY